MVFYLGWAQSFPRKKSCVSTLFYSAVICCSLLSHEQAVRTGAVTVCEKLATTFKSIIHPPLVFCTHNPNKWYQSGFSKLRLTPLRDPRR